MKLAKIKAALERLTSAYVVIQDIDHETFVSQKEMWLSEKKTRGEALKPWSYLVFPPFLGEMVRDTGFEPVTPTVSR